MFTRRFDPRQFLRLVQGTEPFIDYCRARGITFDQRPGWPMHEEDYGRWLAAVRGLPEGGQATVEVELAQVNELAHSAGIGLLVAALQGSGLPPDDIPGDAALSLWFLLHHSDLFHEAFMHQEIAEVGSWRTASTLPGLRLDDLSRHAAALGESLKAFFRLSEGTGRFCAVEAYELAAATCFVAHVADRLCLFDAFTEDGRRVTHSARRAVAVIFAYYPSDGRILLKTHCRAVGRVRELFRRFGEAVLGMKLTEQSLAPAFHLDLFKRKFDPLPAGPDIGRVKVRAVQLAYPQRLGRRQVRLEVLGGDEPFAILDLLRIHGGGDALLRDLEVRYVELQVQVLAEQPKECRVRLWPDRCSLNQTGLGERLRACLRQWGIAHDE
jgi:hypothetical protein